MAHACLGHCPIERISNIGKHVVVSQCRRTLCSDEQVAQAGIRQRVTAPIYASPTCQIVSPPSFVKNSFSRGKLRMVVEIAASCDGTGWMSKARPERW